MPKRETAVAYAKWALPGPFNWLIYCVIIVLTFVVSNMSGINSLFKYAELKSEFLDKISGYFDRFLPENLSANLATFIFWALVGLIVYFFIIIVANFTSDLKENLSVDKYIYPVGMDKYGSLKHFILVNIERIFGTIVLIIYLNLMLSEFMPHWTNIYRQTIEQWPINQDLALKLLLSIIAEFLMLHGLVVLLRLIILRRRVLGL